MDVVVRQGDQLIIETDVVDADEEPINCTGADVRYVADGQVDMTEGDDDLEIVDGEGEGSRVRVIIDSVDWDVGRYRHEAKIFIPGDSGSYDIGPAEIIRGTIFVLPSLIGNNMETP